MDFLSQEIAFRRLGAVAHLPFSVCFSPFSADSSQDKQGREHCLSGVGLGGRVASVVTDLSLRSHLIHWSVNDRDLGLYPGSGSC